MAWIPRDSWWLNYNFRNVEKKNHIFKGGNFSNKVPKPSSCSKIHNIFHLVAGEWLLLLLFGVHKWKSKIRMKIGRFEWQQGINHEYWHKLWISIQQMLSMLFINIYADGQIQLYPTEIKPSCSRSRIRWALSVFVCNMRRWIVSLTNARAHAFAA